MKKITKGLFLTLIAFQLISCSSENSVEDTPVTDEILKGNVTSIGGPMSTDFVRVSDVAVDQKGDIYVADSNDKRIKKIQTSNGSNTVTIFAGNNSSQDVDGIGTAASFHFPQTLTFSKDYKTLYVGTWRKIRAIDIATKKVTTVAGGRTGVSVNGGDDGIGVNAVFAYPLDIVLNNSGTTMYVSEHIQSGSVLTKRIRKVDLATKKVTTLSWNNLPTSFSPQHMIVDAKDENLYLASTNVILKMNLTTNNVTVLAGSNTERGTVDGIGTLARFDNAYSLAFSPNESFLYVGQGNGRGKRAIRVIDMKTNEVTTLTGGTYGYADGNASTAKFKDVYGMSYDKDANKLYIVDTFNKAIRIIK